MKAIKFQRGDIVRSQRTNYVVVDSDLNSQDILGLTGYNKYVTIPLSKVKLTSTQLPLTARLYSYMAGTYSGSDPEIFIENAGKVIPAWEFLEAPNKAQVRGANQIKTFWDGVQAEVTINSGGISCHAYLIDYLREGLVNILDAARDKFPQAKLLCEDVVKIDMSRYHDDFVRLGCAPSENIYNIPPIMVDDPRKLGIRFAGCHIHNSTKYIKKPSWFPHGTVAMMDKVCGVLLTAMGRNLENPLRRRYYGRPGEFRVPYSKNSIRLEYRTPGAFLYGSPQAFHFALDMARVGFKLGMIYDGREFPMDDVKDIILECDADAARKYITKYKSFYGKIFSQHNYSIKGTFELLRQGIKQYVSTPEEMWRLDKSWENHSNRNAVFFLSLTNKIARQ